MNNIPDEYKKPGYGTLYSDVELKQAIAIKEIQGSAGSGGSGGDASAANQETEIAKLTSIDGNLYNFRNDFGSRFDSTAEDDGTGTGSFLGYFKRLLSVKLGENIAGTIIPTGGSGIRGLLSWIAKLISDRLPTGLTISNGKLLVDIGSFSSGGASAAEIKTAIETANNLDTIEVSLQEIKNKVNILSDAINVDDSISSLRVYDSAVSDGAGAISTGFTDGIASGVGLALQGNYFNNTTVASSDTQAINFLPLFKRLLQKVTFLIDRLPSNLISDRLKTQTVLDSTVINGTASATDGLVIPSTDCSNYSFLSLQLTGTWSGIVIFEFSNDNTNWIGGALYNLNSTGTPNTVTTTNSIYYGNKQGRYFRARLFTYSSGTVNGTLNLSTTSTTPAFPVTTISGTPSVNLSTINGSSPDLATQTTLSALNNKLPTGLTIANSRLLVDIGGPASSTGGVYNATSPTLSDTQSTSLQLSNRGDLITTFVDRSSITGNITVRDTNSTFHQNWGNTNQNIYVGTPTANSFVLINCSGSSSFSINIIGTFTGTLSFEKSFDDGTTWVTTNVVGEGTNYSVSNTSNFGKFVGNSASCTNIRVRATTAVTGTATIKIMLGVGNATTSILNGIRLFDRISGAEASIKQANTLPVSTDTASVVTLRELPTTAATSSLQTSILNRLMPAGNSSNLYTTSGNQISLNIQSTPGSVVAIYATNNVSTIRFLQLFNITGLPTNGISPVVSFPIPTNNGLLVIGQDVLGGEGLRFTNGISFGISTTLFTYTAATATNEVFLNIRYL